jgi:hypothetical protein
MIFPDSNLVGSSANLFLANSNVLGVEYSAFGSGLRNYSKQGGDNRRNSFALYTSDIGQQNTNRLYINYNGDIGINDDTPSYKLDINGTLNATGAATLSNTLAVTGNITENGINVIKGSGTASYIPKFTSSDDIANSSILDNNGIIVFDSSIIVNDALTVVGATYYSGYQKETGTSLGDFDVIAAGTSIYIFEQTSAGSGTTTKEFLGSAASNTGRVITISNISDNAWDMAFTSIKPYIKTSTTINQVSSGQSITILSDGSKWWVISRNF